MTSAYILILAILFLGGMIAFLGDRLGSRIGKARLQLFRLRPRNTAMVITILTGISIAAMTLGSLFALSKSLRRGVFELDDILRDRRQLEQEVNQISQAKKEAEQALAEAAAEQKTVEQRLKRLNQNFRAAQQQLRSASSQAVQLRDEIQSLLTERKNLTLQREELSQQRDKLQQGLKQREAEIAQRDRTLDRLSREQGQLQAKIIERDQSIVALDEAIASKDQDLQAQDEELQAKASQLETVEGQLKFLQREVEVLEEYYRTYQDLREREIALLRGQVLAVAIVKILEPDKAIEAVDELLRQANRQALQATNSEAAAEEGRLVKITKIQVQQLLQQIRDGREYVVRIISAGNYVQGEPEVRVFADVTQNRQIFSNGEAVAAVSIDQTKLTEQEIQERLDLLLSAAQFRARSAGVIGTIQVGDGRIKTLLDFIEKLKEADVPIQEIQAVTQERTYTAGPLRLQLIAISNGQAVISSNSNESS